jgi:choice-of-anchor C domain-containing protein
MIGQIRLLMILMAFLLLGTLSNAVLAVRVTEPGQRTLVSSLAEQRVVQLSSEGDHTCVLTSDGKLRCWGRSEFGQLNIPADIGPISQLSTGHAHTCVITTSQMLRCWGWNGDGQSTVPADLGPVLQVGAGVYQTCAVTISGQVRCWGQNNFGQLDIPSDLGTATQVSTGNTHVCAIQSSGMLRCWNRNDFGQSTVPADLGPVTQVSTGDYHACAITTSGMLRCWGHNGEGRSNVPSDLGPVIQVSAGATNTCAITTSGSLRCWGHDGGGSNVVPSDLGPVTQVGAGWAHTCALTKAGSVRCWGWNGHGQTNVPDDLLNPPVTPSATPPAQPSTTAAPTTTILPGQSILLNGSFEQPVVPTSHFSTYGTGQTFGHWTVSKGSIDLLSVKDWQDADGQQSIDLSGGEAGTIYQDLATTIGATYQVSLAIAGNPTDVPSVKQAEVWWGSSLLATLSFSTSGHSHQSMGWQFHTFTVQAAAPVTRLRLKSLTNGSNGPAIDAVRVVPLDTPTATATSSPTAAPTDLPTVTPTVTPGGLQLRMIIPDHGVNSQPTRVTVVGSGFSTQLPPTAYLVGTSGIFALNQLSVLSSNIFEATVPAGLTPGIYDLMVRSNGDTGILASAFWVLEDESPTATVTATPTPTTTATMTVYSLGTEEGVACPVVVLKGLHRTIKSRVARSLRRRKRFPVDDEEWNKKVARPLRTHLYKPL